METGRSSNSNRKSSTKTPRSGIFNDNSGTTNISTYLNNSNSQETFKRDAGQYMPIANVIKIMRHILPPHAKIADDAKETIQECVSELIGFITSEANEKCHREYRKTITPEDIISAMGTLGFNNYVEPLRIYLNKIRNQKVERNTLQRFPFVKRNASYVQLEPQVTRPPPRAGYALSSITYPVNPNNYVEPSQMSNNYIQNLGDQGGSSSDDIIFDSFMQFK
ncbi:hypothetical protein RD792_013403 [Penstemon davidsonii]|uniref:Transcription factor CBF/NF-Y/archaeal histone domain-containing protein n=1 Tax=Penstemon davidsonii TaxID=160366 RepID=A0ABR0CTV7_9LAMI|nr:hypothetical protein RD792_013403 [Penstemon davidsonii]